MQKSSEHELQQFIAHARDKGLDHATIRMMLLANGWKEKDVLHALSEQELDIPVPLPPDTGGAREAFFHLLTFGFFYTIIISIIFLFFTYINRLFPDVAIEGTGLRDWELSGVRRAIAAIIVSYPMFLWISRRVIKEMARHPERAVSGIRRWLTYLTLLVACAAIVGDLITLVFFLLEGELSVRFILKVFTVLLIAGFTFTYFLFSLRVAPDQKEAKKLYRSYFGISLAAVALALVWGALLIGSPMQSRLKKFDERRVEDLQNISSEIYEYVYAGLPYDAESTMSRSLPRTLEEVALNARYRRINPFDPQTRESYVYTVIDQTHFELCATFDAPKTYDYDIFWEHSAGVHCYSFDLEDRQRF